MTWVVRRHAPRSQGGCGVFVRDNDDGTRNLNHVVDNPVEVNCPACIAATQLPLTLAQ